MRRPRTSGAIAVTAFCALVSVVFVQFTTVQFEDFAVYRAAGAAVLHSTALYDDSFASPLPFTYPPFAALVSVPFALLPWHFVTWLWVFVCVGLSAWVISTVPLPAALPRGSGPAVVCVGVLLAVASVPVSDHLGWGQVGIPLLAMCVADACDLRPRWLPAGVLTGLAAAIKIVPIALLGYFVLARRWRALATGVAALAAACAATAVILPGQSRTFLFDVLPSLSDRVAVGNPEVHGNQSIRAALLRALPDGDVAVVYPILAIIAVALACYGAWRAIEAGENLAGVTILGLCAAAITPIAWTHHFVWLVPAVALCVAKGSRAALAVAGMTLVVTLARLPRLGALTDVPVVSPVFEDSILVAAIASAVVLATRGDRSPEPARRPDR